MLRNDGSPSGYTSDHISAAVQSQFPIGTNFIDINSLQPAPKSWNFYNSLSEFKKSTLKESILARGGIINPVIVWERNDEDGLHYMILSGHNRTESYKDILKNASEKGYTDIVNKFSKISAIVKGQFEIDDNEAQQIIIDCNWAQRDLTPIEKHMSIIKKYTLVKENRNTFNLGDGRLRDKIAEDFNIKGRMIQSYMSLSSLIEEWQSILNEGEITLRVALKLVKFSIDRQKYFFDKHFDSILLGGPKVEKLLSLIKNKTNNTSVDMLFNNMLSDIEKEKDQIFDDYTLKISLKLNKEDIIKLKSLPKKEQNNLHKEIEALIKNKYIV
jgi:hypothetical protein